MINLNLKRIALKDTYTVGHLYVEDRYFCDTIEDKVRDYNKDGDLDEPGEEKIYGETAIPYGRYPVTLIWWAKHNRLVPWIHNVNGFTGILIHAGTTAADTLGCIIVGSNKIKGGVLDSRITEKHLTNLLKDYISKGEQIFINVT